MAPRQPPRKRGTSAPPTLPAPPITPDVPHPTPSPLPSDQTQRTFSNNSNLALQKIKLEVYTGEADITPWVTKAETLAHINKLEDDQAKIAYLHLHLGGEALSWVNDHGVHQYTTLKDFITTLVKQFGLNDTKRQQYRGELIIMEQQHLSVSEITKKFETHWRLAYPDTHGADHHYKLHNYLRVLHPRIASQVGLQRPSSYDEAKDIAYNIELYLPKVPLARLNTLTTEEMQPAHNYLATLMATSSQKHELDMQELKQQIALMASMFQQERERTNDIAEIKQTFNRHQPYNNRYQPYTDRPPQHKVTTTTGLENPTILDDARQTE